MLPQGLTKDALYNPVKYKKWLQKAFRRPEDDLETRIRKKIRDDMREERADKIREEMEQKKKAEDDELAFDSYDEERDYHQASEDSEQDEQHKLHHYFDKLTRKREI